MRRFLEALFLLLLLAGTASGQTATTPPLAHIVIVALENQSYEDVVGSASMPYLNNLIGQSALADNYFANSHGSLSEYFMVTTGELITTDNNFGCNVTIDNLVRQFANAGKTWKAYAESLPSAGYTGGDVYPYVKKHNPFAFFVDVVNNTNEAAHIVPFTQFSSDLANGSLPNFAFVIPNELNNGHDCPGGGATCANADKLAAVDQWLKTNIDPLLSNAAFQQDGLLVIWYDEGNLSDNRFNGGRTATVFAGPRVKPGFHSATFYRHENLLRTVVESLGLNSIGASVYVQSMADIFRSTAPGTGAGSIAGRVTNISPAAGFPARMSAIAVVRPQLIARAITRSPTSRRELTPSPLPGPDSSRRANQ